MTRIDKVTLAQEFSLDKMMKDGALARLCVAVKLYDNQASCSFFGLGAGSYLFTFLARSKEPLSMKPKIHIQIVEDGQARTL